MHKINGHKNMIFLKIKELKNFENAFNRKNGEFINRMRGCLVHLNLKLLKKNEPMQKGD